MQYAHKGTFKANSGRRCVVVHLVYIVQSGAHTGLNSSALKRVSPNCRVITEKSARELVP